MDGNITDELERLASLRERDMLSDAEFAQQKTRLLGGSESAAAAAVPVASPKRRTARNILIACLAVAALLLVIGLATGPAGRTIATGASAPPQKALGVTAPELAQAYDDNEAAAQQHYGGRPLFVMGTVSGIDLDIVNDPVVLLRDPDHPLDVQARLADTDKPKAAGLHKGDTINLLCSDVSEVIGVPMLTGCSIRTADNTQLVIDAQK